MKFIKQLLKNTILRLDMFAATPTFRFNGQSSYQTIFGGCLSFLLVALFIMIFSQSFKQVIEKVNITATLNLQNNPFDTENITDIKFAVGIQGLDFSLDKRYFNIILKKKTTSLSGISVSQNIKLSPCSQSDWLEKGQNFDKLFGVYGMSKMLCASQSQNLTLSGFQGSQQWVTMNLLVQQCRNTSNSNWSCYSPTQINNLIQRQLQQNDFFKVNFFVLNTILSPQQQTPAVSTIQNQIFITFSNTSGSRSQLKLGRYEITTDESIWPTSSETTTSGYYITSQNTYGINLYSTHYVKIEIEKARTIYQIQRQYDKLDDTFSYVGGLFSILFSFVFFFMGSYNEYKYEVAVAQTAFNLDQQGNKLKQDNFNIFTYLQYSLYDWMKTFGINLCWNKMEQIDTAKGQAAQQMDVRLFIKKMQKLQMLSKMLLGEYNIICANLTQPFTLEQVKRMRLINNYYDEVSKIPMRQPVPILNKQNQIKLENAKSLDQKNQTNVNKFEEDQELQEQYQQIEKEICRIYKKHCAENAKNQVSSKIIAEIPQLIKFRFLNIEANYNNQQIKNLKDKQPSQSSLNMNRDILLPPIIIKKVNQII